MRLPLKLVATLCFILSSQNPLQAAIFNITHFGAVGDGKTLNTAAIQTAINAATASHGGIVRIPPGSFLSGSIHLKNNVTLELDAGATLLGSPHHTHYQKLNFHALILANSQNNIGIRGKGTIDGQGVRLVADTMRLHKEGKLPDANEGQRPSLINFRNCSNITLRDITLLESACWVQLYRECSRLLIENIKVRTCAAITNDGLDIDSCSDVIVRGCDIDSEDDAICLKSGPLSCERILIENCRIRSSCNALKFGTASSKGFKNIICRNLEIYDTYFSGIALEIVDGGVMENIRISKVRMTTTNNPIFIRLGHRNMHGKVGTIKDVIISDVTAEIPNRKKSEMNKFPSYWRHLCTTLITGSISGLPGHPVRDITLRNVHITYGGIGDAPQRDHILLKNMNQVPECAQNYPESKMFGVLPAWGLYCRHADGLTFENVTLRVAGRDYRAGAIFDDVKNLKLDQFNVLHAGKEPVIVFNDVQKALIRESRAPKNTTKFLDTRGKTRDVVGP